MRISDVISLEWSSIEGDQLECTMMINGKVKKLLLPQLALDILEHYEQRKNGRYVFPYLHPKKEYTIQQIVSGKRSRPLPLGLTKGLNGSPRKRSSGRSFGII